jgi:EAL domain-containing protein (putative c-di-GMP-specific phosphodiesterase class I)/DNA-binding NarL/FixJ family response regulator
MKKILIVDDDPVLLAGLRRSLGRHFETDTASSGREALSKIEAHPEYAAIVSDMNMGGMDGLEFLERARGVLPHVPRIMLTGSADSRVLLASINRAAVTRFLHKPVSADELVKCLHGCLAEAESRNLQTETTPQGNRIEFIRQGLARADFDREFHLLFQPRIAADSGSVAGVEALLRWSHPQLGAITPAEFIPVAESGPMIDSITDWVLRRATATWRGWKKSGLDVAMSVNVSPASLGRSPLVESIARSLQKSDMPPERLELEITEGYSLTDDAQTRRAFSDLKNVGVKVSLDDFGTGFSSMSYIQTLDVDCVKIDRSFIMNAPENPKDRAILLAVRELTRSLGLSVVAEGVETEKHDDLVRRIGIDEMQGFFHSRPLAAEAMPAWVDHLGADRRRTRDPQNQLRLLIVDDDANLLAGLKRHLRRQVETTLADTPEEALRQMRAAAQPFDSVISDLRMPGMDGVTLLQRVASESPSTRRILLTGSVDDPRVTTAQQEGLIHELLPKPCPPERLLEAVKRLGTTTDAATGLGSTQ